MSCQKGNASRTRPQKYKNHFAFKNSLHDTSKKTKLINSLQIVNVCERCKKIIEWKIKYKKYKALKAPAKCNKCEKKTVKHAYHTMCHACARERKVCPKCGTNSETLVLNPTKEEQIKLDAEMQEMLKSLTERKRRTFIRYMNKQTKTNECKKNTDAKDEEENEENESSEKKNEHLLNKLKSLMIDDDFDSYDEEGSVDESNGEESSDIDSNSDISDEN